MAFPRTLMALLAPITPKAVSRHGPKRLGQMLDKMLMMCYHAGMAEPKRTKSAKSRKWERLNPEKVLEMRRRWRAKNRERIRKSGKAWAKKNRAACVAAQLRYRTAHPWQEAWRLARNRCVRPGAPGYAAHGGIGVKFLLTPEQVHELWIRDAAGAILMPSLDRIDYNGDFTPANCRFVSRSEISKKMWREKRAADPGWSPRKPKRRTAEEMGTRYVVGEASPNFGATEQNVT